MNHGCDYCGSEYPSAWAAAECGEQDRIEDANTRAWFGKYRPNHRGI